jgi:hypothetical protein
MCLKSVMLLKNQRYLMYLNFLKFLKYLKL